MTRIAVVTGDVLGERMAGPAIRALNIAAQLSRVHDVTLVSTAPGSEPRQEVRCVITDQSGLRAALETAEVVVLQGFVAHQAPWLLRTDKILVADLYDPLHLEQLERARQLPVRRRQESVDLTVRVLNEQMLRADFMVCASDAQRLMWLGHLSAIGRANVETHGADPTLRSLIDVVPFGLSPTVPAPTSRPFRDGLGLGDDARIIVWAGGVYDWLDPLIAIRAVDRLRHSHPDVRLVFQGMQHPNPDVPAMDMPQRCTALSDELGLTDAHVFFTTGWVPYDERHNHLLDADLGISTHTDHLEAELAFRARILDYLWAGLPVVATQGDTLAAKIDAEGLGAVVPPGDVDALAAALERQLYDTDASTASRANVSATREQLSWELAVQPLLAFCAAPHRAADAGLDRDRLVRMPVLPARAAPRLAARTRLALRSGGIREVATRGASWLRRRRG